MLTLLLARPTANRLLASPASLHGHRVRITAATRGGGSENDYDYVSGDPVNAFDLDGTLCFSCAGRKIKNAAKSAAKKFKCVAGELNPFDFSIGSAVAGGAAVGSAGVTAARESAKFAAKAAKLGIAVSGSTVGTGAAAAWIIVGVGVAGYGAYNVYEVCKHA